MYVYIYIYNTIYTVCMYIYAYTPYMYLITLFYIWFLSHVRTPKSKSWMTSLRDGGMGRSISITRTSIAIAYSRHIDLYILITSPSNQNVNHISVMFG